MKYSYGNLGTKFILHSVDISNAQDNLEMTKFIHHSVENSNAQHLNNYDESNGENRFGILI